MLVTETDKLVNENVYFSLTNDGNLVSLGKCRDFDEADDKAGDESFWILDPSTAIQWAQTISNASKS